MASNENYIRYDAEGNPVVPQPGSTQDTSDPGLGWQTTPYKNFSADYVARDADDNPRTPLPYIPRGEGNQIIPKDTYVRMDADCNPVVSPGPLVPAPAGQIFAPEGLVVGRVIYALAAQFTGGTPPITYEAQLQRETAPGIWEGFTPWVNAVAASRTLSINEEGMRIRANTRISDRNNPVPIIVPGTASTQVQPEMAAATFGTLTGTGLVGTTMTQTESTITGGIGPFTKTYEWLRKRQEDPDTSFRRFGVPNGLTYVVQESDIGFDIRGRTRWIDSFGVAKSVAAIPRSLKMVGPIVTEEKGALIFNGSTVGTVLTQTFAEFSGGTGEYTLGYGWVRRLEGSQGFFDFGAPATASYTVQASDIGYEIRGRTTVVDSQGNSTNSGSTVPLNTPAITA